MEQQDDPYEILGVPSDASESQIRSAYRKAALRSHPDKVSPEQRPAANIRFAKISNAYELLSDPQKRAQYDQEQQQQQQAGFFAGEQSSYPPQGSGDFGWDHFFARGGFHDPFQVFHSVFREEFGGPRASFSRHDSRRAAAPPRPFDSFFFGGRDPFDDPFFEGVGAEDNFFGRGSMFGRGFGFDDFGGHPTGSINRRRTRDPFEDMFASMHSMQRQMEEQMRSQGRHGNNNNNQHQSFYYSSNSMSGGPGGESVTTQTTRRIVNGQEEVMTERIVRKADGTVERQVLDNRNGSRLLQHDNGRNDRAGAIPGLEDAGDNNGASARGFPRLLPWGRRRHSSRKAKQPDDNDDDLTPAKRSPADADLDNQKRRREP